MATKSNPAPIFIGVDSEKVELKGEPLDAYLLESEANKTEIKASKAEATAKADARVSAFAKLAKLGLTQAEIDAL